MNNTNPRRHPVRGIVTGVVSLVLLLFALFLFLQRQYLVDLVSYWSYDPPAVISSINDRVDFTDRGTFYFYTTHPVVADSSSFNQECPRQEATSPILGCYSEDRIFIFDITNEQLDGIEEVTAAHEMLHAVWTRLDEKTKERVTDLLLADYEDKASAELQERIAYYERNEPGEVVNELHSILGTEEATLTPELEDYYETYFTDRQKVVDLHDQYDKIFQDLKTQADRLYVELEELSKTITAETAAYNQAVVQLETDIASFNQRANSGAFDSAAEFYAERNQLIARSNALEADRQTINYHIETYNMKYKQYQAIGEEIESLNQSIDSFEAPEAAPSL